MNMNSMKKKIALLLCLSLTLCLAACGAEKKSEDSTEEQEPVSGGWSTGEPTELTDEQRAVFDKAMAGMTGVSYAPVLYIGFQVVAGYNHRFLCKAQGVYPDAPETWAIVEIYEDLEDNAEVTNVVGLTDEQAAQYGVDVEPTAIGGMQIANPFIDCDSLAAAAEIAGFEITVPETVEGYPERLIQAVDSDMIQVFYATGDMAEEDARRVLLRKAVGSEDISGDYTDYAEAFEQETAGKTVTLKGDGEKVYLAVWTEGGYSYSVSVSDGASVDAMLALVKNLH